MVSKLLSILVSGFQSFLAVRFQSFLVSGFQSLLVSKALGFKIIGFKVSKIHQMSISCFLEDIDPISKVSKNLLDGSSGFLGIPLFENVQYFGFPTC